MDFQSQNSAGEPDPGREIAGGIFYHKRGPPSAAGDPAAAYGVPGGRAGTVWPIVTLTTAGSAASRTTEGGTLVCTGSW